MFVPTKSYEYDAKRAHADILCMLAPMPSASEWSAKGLEKYGLVAVAKNGLGAASFSRGVFVRPRASTRDGVAATWHRVDVFMKTTSVLSRDASTLM